MNYFKLRFLFLSIMFIGCVHGQNFISVPFDNGFVGDNTGSNVSSNSYYLSGTEGLGWSNVQFAQNSSSTFFVAQGNDIIGKVLITDNSGVDHVINGFIKWRAPSGNVTTIVFQPLTGVNDVLATNSFNGSTTYTLTDTNYIGLTFNGELLTISPVPGEVTGNASTAGLLDLLNNYLAQFPSISIADLTVNEDDGTATVEVTLSKKSTNTITVRYTTNNGTALSGSDFDSTYGIVTFVANDTLETIPVSIVADQITEVDELLNVTLSKPTNASIFDDTATITILDTKDSDGDGVSDKKEITDNTDPNHPCDFVLAHATLTPSTVWNDLDCDGDGVKNQTEITDNTDPSDPCDLVLANATLAPSTAWNDLDCDGDGVSNSIEITDGTNPTNPCDLILASVTLTPAASWNTLDCDNDGLPNGDETGTDPLNPDTDGDGVTDSSEVADGTNPTNPCDLILASVTLTPAASWNTLDCDNDGLPNGDETGTDPLNPDTDGDGVTDSTEIADGTNPTNPCDLILASVTLTPAASWNTLDCDNDGLPNGDETGTDPLNPDSDGDGVSDSTEIADGTNPNNPCDLILASVTLTPSANWNALDCDNDGLPNGDETGTDPLNPDSDGDGVSDSTEIADGTNPNNPCDLILASVTLTPAASWNTLDCDNDGLPNGDETGTDPLNPDSDGDGVSDSTEIADGTNPNNPCEFILASVTLTPSANWNALDCDNDGLPNGSETGTDPLNPDSDGDGVSDSTEVANGTNPNDPCSLIFANVNLTPTVSWNSLDCDNDGIPNGDETGTDPLNPDTDGDGVSDSTEIADGTNPTNPCDLILASVTLTPAASWNTLDCDNDGLPNGDETGTDPLNPDTDGDGVSDAQEIQDGTNPNDPCSLVLTSATLTPTTAWNNLDCDKDGISNGEELTQGNPLDPCDPNGCDVTVPNAFSPNNDNTNDVLVIKGLEAFPENEITIFNRWGATVYHKTSYQNNWNGTSENSLDIGGDNLPVGTYFYVLDLHVEGKDILKGYIFLQR